MNVNKNLQILVTALLLAFIGLGVYVARGYLGIKQTAQIYQRETVSKNIEIVPNKPVALSNQRVRFATIDTEGTGVYFYEISTGNIFHADFSGKKLTQISQKSLPNAREILWSPNKKEVIVTSQGVKARQKYYHRLKTNTNTPLSELIGSVDYCPDSKKIAYNYFNNETGEGNIALANPDGSDFVSVFKTRSPTLRVFCPRQNLIALKTTEKSFQSLFFIKPSGQGLQTVLEGQNISIRWSDDGQFFLYSTTDRKGENAQLFVQDTELRFAPVPLSVPLQADQCSWNASGRSIICSLEKSIIKIDTRSAEVSELLPQTEAQQAFMDPAEEYLFFIDQDDILRSYKLTSN